MCQFSVIICNDKKKKKKKKHSNYSEGTDKTMNIIFRKTNFAKSCKWDIKN